MRLTIDIDKKVLRDIQKATGNRKRSPAVREALKRYLREREKRELLRKVLRGETDFGMTNDELEKLGTYDSD
ncbi:MAG: type II toxin-antitoxin system VapB family antitoxin [Candidatus Brocadiia bacterium]